jgi:16S rRNA (cytosine967-C5)-methyltransferase
MEQLMEYNPEKTKISPYGIRFRKRFNIDTLPLFKKGIIEVQEEGSQLVALAIQVKETDCVLDLCAGALGKTLMLSDLMQNKGKIIATDISDTRLEKGKKRLKRARVSNVSILRSQEFERKFEQRFKQSPYFDCILIDAPCSGTGTWRRHPEMKMRFAQSDLKKLIAVQRSLLLKALPLLKKGGKIIYATCSLLPDENQENIEWFLDKTHATFEMLESDNLNPKFFYTKGYYQFNPYTHETDGFFISILKKKDSRDIS